MAIGKGRALERNSTVWPAAGPHTSLCRRGNKPCCSRNGSTPGRVNTQGSHFRLSQLSFVFTLIYSSIDLLRSPNHPSGSPGANPQQYPVFLLDNDFLSSSSAVHVLVSAFANLMFYYFSLFTVHLHIHPYPTSAVDKPHRPPQRHKCRPSSQRCLDRLR